MGILAKMILDSRGIAGGTRKLPPEVSLAVAAHESNWMRDGFAQAMHNYHGISAIREQPNVRGVRKFGPEGSWGAFRYLMTQSVRYAPARDYIATLPDAVSLDDLASEWIWAVAPVYCPLDWKHWREDTLACLHDILDEKRKEGE